MPAGFTPYAVDAILAGTPMPTTFYIKLHLDYPGPNALLFPAAETTRAAADMVPGTLDHSIYNDDDIDWVTVAATEIATYISGWDASSGGNPWFVGQASPPVDLVSGGSGLIRANRITLYLPPLGA